MTENEKIAELLFKDVKDKSFYENKYSKRVLENQALVTRFAPSPTGYVHIGNFMQAVLDYQLAVQSGGLSIVRIEDTDGERKVDDAVSVLLSTLNYYNLNFNEGVISQTNIVGEYGPYYQSERGAIYAAFAKYLVATGQAYPCFCTKEIEAEIRTLQGEKNETGYYGKYRRCNNLTYDEIKNNLEAGKPYTIRFRSKSTDLTEKIAAYDVVRGKLELQRWFKDEIILKSDGMAVYHFAHIVDDYLMGTNLIVRGSEWLSTLALHIELWNAFKITPPNYLHTLLIFKKEGDKKVKISKRLHPEAKMDYYKEKGYPQESILEYIYTLLNSNFEDWRKANPSKKITEFEMSFKKMNPSEALFDLDKLNDISKTVISKFNKTELYDLVLAYAKQFDNAFYQILIADKSKWLSILNIDRESEKPRKDIAYYSEIPTKFCYFIDRPAALCSYKTLSKPEIELVLDTYAKTYKQSPDKTSWWDALKSVAESLNFATDNKIYKANPENFKGNVSDFSAIIRLAVTGLENTPDLFEILNILGEEEVLTRLSQK